MTPLEQAAWVGVALVGLGGSAMCSGMETGIYAISRPRLAVRAQRGALARLLEREIDQTDRSIATLLIANNAFNYIGVLGVTTLLGAAGYSEATMIVLNALIVTPVLLVFAESLPKELFRRSPNRLLVPVGPLLRSLRMAAAATGLLWVVLAFARGVGRLTGLPPEPVLGMRQRLAEMLKEGGGGAMSAAQADLIDRSLAFRRAVVAYEMIPWRSVHAVAAAWDRQQLLDFLAGQPHRRFPVVDRSGRVVGVLDSVRAFTEGWDRLEEIVDPPLLVQARLPAREALARLYQHRAHLAVVERGGRPVGIVTAKDLVEPLIGELAAW